MNFLVLSALIAGKRLLKLLIILNDYRNNALAREDKKRKNTRKNILFVYFFL